LPAALVYAEWLRAKRKPPALRKTGGSRIPMKKENAMAVTEGVQAMMTRNQEVRAM
jgi:hypothetical protein